MRQYVVTDNRIEGHVHRPDLIWKTFLFYTLSSVFIDFVIVKTIGSWKSVPAYRAVIVILVAVSLYGHLLPLWDRLFGAIGLLDKWFVMDDDGISYHARGKDFYLSWQDIRHVELYPNRVGRFDKNCFLCFASTEQMPLGPIDWHRFTNEWFGVQYRPELVPFSLERAKNAGLTEDWALSVYDNAGRK